MEYQEEKFKNHEFVKSPNSVTPFRIEVRDDGQAGVTELGEFI